MRTNIEGAAAPMRDDDALPAVGSPWAQGGLGARVAWSGKTANGLELILTAAPGRTPAVAYRWPQGTWRDLNLGGSAIGHAISADILERLAVEVVTQALELRAARAGGAR